MWHLNLQITLSDEDVCDVISKSITEIIQISKNHDFKERCYETLQISVIEE